MMAVGVVVGYIIAIFLFILGLYSFLFSPTEQLKDTPLRLTGRFIIALIVVSCAPSLAANMMTIANNLWSDYIISGEFSNVGTKAVKFEHFLPGLVEYSTSEDVSQLLKTERIIPKQDTKLGNGVKAVVTLFGEQIKTAMSPGMFAGFALLIIVLAAIPMLRGFFRLYIEVIERYLVVVLLWLFSGAVAGTLVSKNASSVFWSYMKMMTGQLFLLITNMIFMKLFIVMLVSGNLTISIPNYIFGLAYLRAAQRIDSYMASMGLNIAQTGGQTLDTLLGAVALGTQSLSRGRRSAASAGEGMKAMALDGKPNSGLYMAGAALSMLGGNIAGNVNPKNQMLVDAGKRGQKMSPDLNTAAGAWDSYKNNPKYGQAVFEGMNDTSKLAGFNAKMQENGTKISATSVKTDDHGNVHFAGHMVDDPSKEVKGSFNAEDGFSVDNMRFENTTEPGQFIVGDADEIGMMTATDGVINNDNAPDAQSAMVNDDGSISLYSDQEGNNLAGTYLKGDSEIIEPYKPQPSFEAPAPAADGSLTESGKEQIASSLGIRDASAAQFEPVGTSGNRWAIHDGNNSVEIAADKISGDTATYSVAGEYHAAGSKLDRNDTAGIQDSMEFSGLRTSYSPKNGGYTGRATREDGSQAQVFIQDMAHHPSGLSPRTGYQQVGTYQTGNSRLAIYEKRTERVESAASRGRSAKGSGSRPKKKPINQNGDN